MSKAHLRFSLRSKCQSFADGDCSFGMPPHNRQVCAVYLFWEPQNWEDIAECKQHRIEVEDLASKVAGSAVKFRWMSYIELWQLWTAMPRLFEHARTLKERYETAI